MIIEYDGDHHGSDLRQRARDLERREEIERLGYRIIAIQKHHFYEQPDHVLERIGRARLDRGAARDSCRIRGTWRNYQFRG